MGAGFLSASGAPAQERRETQYLLTIQTSMTAGEPGYRAVQEWLEGFHEAAGGRLIVEVLPAGAVVRYDEALDAVAAGAVDGAMTLLLPFADRDPAFALAGDLVGGYETPWQLLLWCERGGGAEVLGELLAPYEARLVACATPGREAFAATVPVEGVADLEGLRVRAPAGLARELFRRAGARPVDLPPAEVFGALEEGRLDATDWGPFALNHESGLHELAGYAVYPGIHSMPLLAIVVGEDSWGRLPVDLRALLGIGMRELAWRLAGAAELRDREAVAAARREGLEVIDWPREERDALRAIARGVWEKAAEGSETAEKVYESHVAFMERIGLLGVEEGRGGRE